MAYSKTRRRARVKSWTAREITILRKQYRNWTNGMIAKSLNRSVASVRAKAGALNLRKSANFLSVVAKTAGSGGYAKSGRKFWAAGAMKGQTKTWGRTTRGKYPRKGGRR